LRHAIAALRAGEALDLRAVAPWRRRALREALGRAALIVAEDAVEALIAVEVPSRLSFVVEEYKHGAGIPKWERDYQEQLRRTAASRRAFNRFLALYGERLRSADRGVAVVIAQHSAPAIVTVMQHLTLAVRRIEDDVYFDIHSKYDFPRPGKLDHGHCNYYALEWPWVADELIRSSRTLVDKPDYWTVGRYFDPGDRDEFSGPLAPG
ncbi:MAG: hypothetical protein H0T76_22990, partial [Nannocystis sp.]